MVLRGESRYVVGLLSWSVLAALLSVIVFTSLALSSPSIPVIQKILHQDFGGVSVDTYNAVLNGTVLTEEVAYHVAGGKVTGSYTMLYRSWDAPLSAPGAYGEKPHIEFLKLSCPEGFYSYWVDYHGDIHSNVPPDLFDELENKLRQAKAVDEAGCYNPHGIRPGVYHVTYEWRLVPPGWCDGSNCSVDLLLARGGKHLRYERVDLTVLGAHLAALSPLNRDLKVAGSGGVYRVTGGPLYKSDPLEFFLVYGSGSGVVEVGRVDNATRFATSLAGRRAGELRLALALTGGLTLMPLTLPLYTTYAYMKYGRERRPTGAIPTGLPPRTGEKPWEVAALYSGRPGVVGWNMIAAAIFELEMKGLVRRTVEPSGRVVLQLREADGEGARDLDVVEATVLSMLLALSDNGIVSEETVKERAKDTSVRAELLNMRGRLEEKAEELAERAIEMPRSLTKAVLGGIVLLVALYSGAGFLSSKVAYTSLIIAASIIAFALTLPTLLAMILLPSNVFGRWRPGYLERYIAWTRFKEEAKGLAPGSAAGIGVSPELLAYAAAVGVEDLGGDLGKTLSSITLLSKRIWRGLYPRTRGSGGGGG
ncbi:MAG: DUF2207 domain-containing protein, partial [Desulfurococcales archaeon]|nr:DUF2207 domain-containing protein [Desulfurococcales archaeon]